MPNAIKNGGVIFGGIGTIIIGLICAHCVHILVRSSHILCKRTKTPKMTYAETAEAAFLCGPKTIRPFANFSRIFVNAALCSTYIGGACVYVVFVSTSLKQVKHPTFRFQIFFLFSFSYTRIIFTFLNYFLPPITFRWWTSTLEWTYRCVCTYSH